MKIIEILTNLLFLILVLTLANIPYKGKVTGKTSWKKVATLSLWFSLSGIILLMNRTKNLFINHDVINLSIFTLTTFTWITFPGIIRQFGKFPSYYFKNKRNKNRFVARFEYPTMTIKYFEILFQQTMFLFLLFVVLDSLQKKEIIFWFTLIVGIIHLGNLFFMEYKWALFYTALSIPMAILFSNLILNGYVLLTTSVHLAFYLIFNARYWFTNKS